MNEYIQKSRKRNRAILSTLIIVTIGVLFWMFWAGDTDDIEAKADQFTPSGEWRLKSSNSSPPRTICLDGGGCPQLTRVWTAKTPGRWSDVLKSLEQSGWSYTVESDCNVTDDTSEPVPVACSAYGKADNYKFTIYMSTSDIENDHEIRLFLKQ